MITLSHNQASEADYVGYLTDRRLLSQLKSHALIVYHLSYQNNREKLFELNHLEFFLSRNHVYFAAYV